MLLQFKESIVAQYLKKIVKLKEASNAKIKGVYLYFFKRSISEDVFSGVKKFIFKNIGVRAHTKSNIYFTIFCPLWKAQVPCFIYYASQKEKQCKAKEANVGKKLLFFVFLKNFFNINFSTPYRKSQSKALVFSYINQQIIQNLPQNKFLIAGVNYHQVTILGFSTECFECLGLVLCIQV